MSSRVHFAQFVAVVAVVVAVGAAPTALAQADVSTSRTTTVVADDTEDLGWQ